MRFAYILQSNRRLHTACYNPRRIWSYGERLFVEDYSGAVHVFDWPWRLEYDADV